MEEIPNKTVLLLLALMSVNSDKPGSRTDAHAKLLWFYRCSFEEIQKKIHWSFHPLDRACVNSNPDFEDILK